MTEQIVHRGPKMQPNGLFGNWLAEQITKNGMTVHELAGKINFSTSAVSRYVGGDRYPMYTTVKRMCEIFNEPNHEAVYTMILDDKYNKKKQEILCGR